METLKTAVIVVLLLAVLYGAYVVLNRPEAPPPPAEIAWHEQQAMEPLQIDFGEGGVESPDVSFGAVPTAPPAAQISPRETPERTRPSGPPTKRPTP